MRGNKITSLVPHTKVIVLHTKPNEERGGNKKKKTDKCFAPKTKNVNKHNLSIEFDVM